MSSDEVKPISEIVTNSKDEETSVAMTDAERSEKILKAKELYSRGSRNYLVKNYAESADELSMVCELYRELYGELSDELGMPYLLYAKSLIALALDENKIIDVPDEEDDDDDDEDDDGDDEDDVNKDDAGEQEDEEMENGEGSGGSKSKPINDVTAKKAINEAKAIIPSNNIAKQAAAIKDDIIVADSTAEKNSAEEKVALTDETVVSSTADTAELPKNGGSATTVYQKLEEKPSTSSNGVADSGNIEEDSENEAASTLQLAWEILELAAMIFERQGLSGLPNLAEVQTELANIEFENNILDSAREDYEKALKIYSGLAENYRRAMAEIHYKIGLTYLMHQMNQEGAASLKEACKLIEGEIAELRTKADPTEKEKNTIQDMEETKEEILVKINEIEEAQAQNIAEVRAALNKVIAKPSSLTDNSNGADPSSSSADIGSSDAAAAASSLTTAAISSSTKPTDISHLIKRKKPEEPNSEAEASLESPAKRPAV